MGKRCPVPKGGVAFHAISTWDPDFKAAILRHYPGSKGAPPGRKQAWAIEDSTGVCGFIGIGEPSFALAARRNLEGRDTYDKDGTWNIFMYRLERRCAGKRAGEVLKLWHEIGPCEFEERYGVKAIHFETIVGDKEVKAAVPGATFRRAGYRVIGRTSGLGAKRPPGHTHGKRKIVKHGKRRLVFYKGPAPRKPRS